MIEKALESGDLKPGQTVIEGTSGNTGMYMRVVDTVSMPCGK